MELNLLKPRIVLNAETHGLKRTALMKVEKAGYYQNFRIVNLSQYHLLLEGLNQRLQYE